jgi:predicted permease
MGANLLDHGPLFVAGRGAGMRRLRALLMRLSGLLKPERSERDLAEEIASHLQLHIDDNLRAGMTPDQARRDALLKMGGIEAVKEQCRERRGLPFLDQLGQDLRYSARQLRRSPGFTAVAVLSLALGIGANTAIFTLLDQVLLRTLPVKNPQELVQLQWHGENNAPSFGKGTVSYPFYRDIRDRNRAFTGVMCRFDLPLAVAYHGETTRVTGELVSGNYFEVLGVPAALGRTFTAEDDRVGGSPIAVLSYDFWTDRFGADPRILGQTILVNNFPITIIGVSAKGFHGVELGWPSQIRIPVSMKKEMTGFFAETFSLENRRAAWLDLFARLAPGVTREQAQASMAPLFRSILEAEAQAADFVLRPGPQQAFTREQFLKAELEVLPAAQGPSWIRVHYGTPLRILMVLVGVMLLMAAVNVANLLLARSAARQREMAVRLAIGAGTARLVRQALTEAAILTLLGSGAGLLLGMWSDRLILAMIPVEGDSLRLNTAPDLRILAFTSAVSVLTALGFGLFPALRAPRTEVISALKEQPGSGTPRVRRLLVAGQVFLSTILLLAAGLFLRSLVNLRNIDPGFQTSHVLTFSLPADLNGYRKQRAVQYYRQVTEQIRAIPGVAFVALGSLRVVNGEWWGAPIGIDGYPERPGEDMLQAFDLVTPDYFATLGIQLVEGRYFLPSDARSGQGVAIINQSLARRYFGNRSPLGRRLNLFQSGVLANPEIVGVVRDTKYENLRDASPREVYIDFDQHDDPAGPAVYVKTASDPGRMSRAVRAAVHRVDPNVPVFDMLRLDDQVDRNLAIERLVAGLAAAFGLLAAIVVTAGLYGLMAFTVTRRTREIGLRVALGARRGAVLWMVLREIVALVGTGALLALPVAWAVFRYVQSQLYGVRSADPSVLGGLLIALFSVAAAAAFVPARRAVRVDPMVALRHE